MLSAIYIELLNQANPEALPDDLALYLNSLTTTELLELSRIPDFTQIAYRYLVRICFPNDYVEAKTVLQESAELFPEKFHTIDWQKFYNTLNSAFAIPSKSVGLKRCHESIEAVHQKMFFSTEPLIPASDTEYAFLLLFSFKKPEILAQLQTYQLKNNFSSSLVSLRRCLSAYYLPVASWSPENNIPLDRNLDVLYCCILSGNVQALKHLVPNKENSIIIDTSTFKKDAVLSTAIWLGHKDVIEHILQVYPDWANDIYTTACYYARYTIAKLACHQPNVNVSQWLSKEIQLVFSPGGYIYYNPKRLEPSLFQHLDSIFAARMLGLHFPEIYKPNSCDKFKKAAQIIKNPDNVFLKAAREYGIEYTANPLPSAATPKTTSKRKTLENIKPHESKRVHQNPLAHPKFLAEPTDTSNSGRPRPLARKATTVQTPLPACRSSRKPEPFQLPQRSSTTQARPVYYSSSSKAAPYQLPEQPSSTQTTPVYYSSSSKAAPYQIPEQPSSTRTTPVYDSKTNKISLRIQPRPLSSLSSFTNSDALMTDLQKMNTVKPIEQNSSDLANIDNDNSSDSTRSSSPLFFNSSGSSSSIGTQSDSDNSDDDDVIYTNEGRRHPATSGLSLPRRQ